MADTLMCSADFDVFFNSVILPLVAYASVATGGIIAIGFMTGKALANSKLILWAKTEALQIFISMASVFFILLAINVFCIIDVGEVATIFEIPNQGSLTIYGAAQNYLNEAALYSHNAMTVTRYHLEAYTVLSFINAFKCDYPVGPIGIGCWYGYSGKTQQPLGGFGSYIAALNIFFNGTIVAHFSALNYLFILLFIYKGFVFLLLPFGIFMRSMPYMRSFGSLLIAVAMSFLLVFPLILSVLYLMGPVIVDRPDYIPEDNLKNYLDETIFPEQEVSDGWDVAEFSIGSVGDTVLGAEAFYDTYFENGSDITGTIMFAAHAFVAAVFFPTTALLATIASVSYTARLYGDEIDLSKLTQLV